MNCNYTRPAVDLAWADSRKTHIAVATAIHAIASLKRSAEQIWSDPTSAEFDHVARAVQEYVSHGDFPARDDGRYPWGEAVITRGARYEIHCVADENCNSYNPAALLSSNDLTEIYAWASAMVNGGDLPAECLRKLESAEDTWGSWGVAIVDTQTQQVDYGSGFGVEFELDEMED